MENTPARIIMREMHGCGHMYRYCFEDTQFQFREYDHLFPNTVIQERPGLAAQMAVYRLYWPWGLTDEFKDQYWGFLKQHPRETASGLTDRRETAILKWLSWQTEADQAFLEGLLNGIEDQRDPQAASVLLDAVHSRFGGQVKEKKTTRTFKL